MSQQQYGEDSKGSCVCCQRLLGQADGKPSWRQTAAATAANTASLPLTEVKSCCPERFVTDESISITISGVSTARSTPNDRMVRSTGVNVPSELAVTAIPSLRTHPIAMCAAPMQ